MENKLEKLRKFQEGGLTGNMLFDSTKSRSVPSMFPYFDYDPYDFYEELFNDEEEGESPEVAKPVKKSLPKYKYPYGANPTYTLTAKGAIENRSKILNTLISLGLDEATATALTIQAGGESSYNPANSAGQGLGGWLSSYNIRQSVLDHINELNNTSYQSLIDVPIELQAEALKWWYYDPYKSQIDAQPSVYKKAEMFAKIGLSPAIVKNGRATWRGKVYEDTPEGWISYLTDTGNNPNGRYRSLEDQILYRIKRSGYDVTAEA